MDFIFVMLYLLFPFFVLFLMKTAGLSFFKITIPSVVVGSMFVFAYVGILPLYFGWDTYHYIIGVQDKIRILQMFALSSWSILTMVLGFVFANKCIDVKHRRLIPAEIRPLKYREKLILLFLLIFCLIILKIYISKIPRIAIFVALSEGFKEAKIARSLMGNAFAGKYHWYKLVIRDLLSLITYAFYANWLITKGKHAFVIFSISFCLATFSLVMATEKAPFAWFLVALCFVYILVSKDGNLSMKNLIGLIFSLVVILIIFYLSFMGSRNISSSIFSVFSRTFTGSIAPSYFYLEFFPAQHDFLWGISFPNPRGIFPFEHYRLTVELMNWRFPYLAERGITGSMPTVFWGEIYANFGLWGVFLLPFFIGFLIYFLSYFVHKLENTPIKIAFIVWLIMHYKNLSVTGVSGFLIDIYFAAILFFVIIIVIIANKGKLKYYTL